MMTEREEACETCDGSGILTDCGGHLDPPEGYTIIQRCDRCERYPDDLAAAEAWGFDARCDACGAIARPRNKPIPEGSLP